MASYPPFSAIISQRYWETFQPTASCLAVTKSAYRLFRHSSGDDPVMGFCLILWHAFLLVEEFLRVHQPRVLYCYVILGARHRWKRKSS